MNSLLLYLLKSTFCIGLLYLVFRTIMRKETFFALNRTLLLSLVICSFLIPLVNLPQIIQSEIPQKLMPAFSINENPMPEFPVMVDLPTPDEQTSVMQGNTESAFPVIRVIGYIYIAGVLISLLVLIHSILSLLLLFSKAHVLLMKGCRLFILEKDIAAFSFCKMVFISRADYIQHGKTILAHEQQHIRLDHFYDLILMEIVKMVHWFNPIIYWLIQDLKAIHEFQADQHTLTKGFDAHKYQLLIIEKGVGSQRFALANSFNHCQIKKRITMMNQSKTSKAGIWKVATFLPLLALLLMAFGRTGENVQMDSPSQKEMLNQEKTIEIEPVTQFKDSIYSIAEVMPEFPGGQMAQNKWLRENVKYPDAAKGKIQGKVFVNFIITNEGKVTNPKIVRSVDPALDAEALRVVSIMPQWIPAKVKGKNVSVSYTLPINFVLSQGPSDKNVPGKSSSEKKVLNQERSNEKGSITQARDSIYTKVEVMPQFPGGDRAIQKFLNENLKYPTEAEAKHIQGKVFVNCIINKEGKIVDSKVVKGVNPLLDAEALRVIRLMPNWIPGKDKGKPVTVSYSLPINFVLQ